MFTKFDVDYQNMMDEFEEMERKQDAMDAWKEAHIPRCSVCGEFCELNTEAILDMPTAFGNITICAECIDKNTYLVEEN